MAKLESQGFPVFAKDASLGGQYPVMAMVLLNPNTGGIFASFGAHPKFEVALERVLTELMQGRSFEGLNDIPMATLNTQAVQEHTNLVEHFIDSSGVVSWKILDEQTDHPFVHWNVPGDTQQEYQYLMDLLKAMGNEVYIADYEDLGAHVCRVLVPGYSEIYQPDDLLWDNVNRGAWFRSDILNVHQLNDDQLGQLLTRLEEAQLDDYLLVGELMGIAFDENSVWGRCTVGELKALIALALKDFETAKHYVDLLLHFNDNVASRKKFYQLLHLGLATALRQDVAWKNLKSAFEKMYGPDLTAQIEQCMKGDLRFPGLEPIQDALGNLTKHQELLDSYRKILNKNRSTSAH
jgi:ribosomal protein S12 methylthiotransferase accessory factor